VAALANEFARQSASNAGALDFIPINLFGCVADRARILSMKEKRPPQINMSILCGLVRLRARAITVFCACAVRVMATLDLRSRPRSGPLRSVTLVFSALSLRQFRLNRLPSSVDCDRHGRAEIVAAG
jgi:hypothetical protein